MLKKASIFFTINLILLAILSLRGFYLYQSLDSRSSSLQAHYNKKIKFRALVCQEVERTYKQQRITLCKGNERILVSRPLYPEYEYGDYLEVSGKLLKPEIFSDFNYPRYLAWQKIYATMYYPSLRQLPKNLNLSQKFFSAILRFKKSLREHINNLIPEPEASLANALILGYKKGIYSEDSDYFRKAGLSHLIVISGTHISILSALLFGALILIGVSRKRASQAMGLFFIFYPILIGSSVAAWRASIMGALVFIAFYFGRLSKTKTALALAANLILLHDPLILYMDLGFQLSFAALLGIIYIYPLSRPLAMKIRSGDKLYSQILLYMWEAFSLTLSCQLFIFPIASYHFNSFAGLSFIANPAIAWLIPLLIASLVLALLLSALMPSLGIIFFSPSYFMLHFFLGFARYIASFENYFISWAYFNERHLIIYYSILFSLLYVIKKLRLKGRESSRS